MKNPKVGERVVIYTCGEQVKHQLDCDGRGLTCHCMTKNKKSQKKDKTTYSISTNIINEDYIDVVYNGKVVYSWNDTANVDYPEDLCWSREISSVFDAGVALGREMERNKDEN